MKRTNKKSITKAEYLQLIGLKELAKKYNQLLNDIYELGQKITGEIDSNGKKELYGHTTDFLNESRELDDMLEILQLTVKEK